MRCRACDCLLQDHETTRRDLDTGVYPDLCDSCFDPLDTYEPNTLPYDEEANGQEEED